MYKILHFELDNNIGGIETFLYNVLKNIDRERFQFDFVTTKENPAFEKELLELGAHIYKVSSYRRIHEYVKEIKGIIIDNQYDAVHIHKNSAANIIPFILAKKSGVKKIIAHSHNTSSSKKGMYNVLHYVNRCKMKEIVTDRLACSEIAAEWLFGKDNKATIVKNGIDVKKFVYNEDISYKLKEKLGISDKFVVGHVGRFTEQKNHMFLLKIFKAVYDKNKSACLVLVGVGNLMEKIRLEVENLGLTKSVIFLGTRNDVADLLQIFDVFVMPSLYEGLPIAGIEAQAAGVPVIASDTISDELKVTSLVKQISLSESPEKWADVILSVNAIVNKKNVIMEVQQSGFSIENTVKVLEKIYRT